MRCFSWQYGAYAGLRPLPLHFLSLSLSRYISYSLLLCLSAKMSQSARVLRDVDGNVRPHAAAVKPMGLFEEEDLDDADAFRALTHRAGVILGTSREKLSMSPLWHGTLW